MAIVIFILALIMFVMLVVVHELGHAIAARRNGVEVEEFGIGFPPRAWSKKLKSGLVFSLNWLPLGGFVKLKGEHDDAKGKGAFGAASLKAKTKILLAGVAINWLTAVFIFTVLALVGIPKLVDNQFTIASDTKVAHQQVLVSFVGKGSPAEKSGLQVGDHILQMAGQAVTSAKQVTDLTHTHAGQKIAIIYTHNGTQHTVATQLNSTNDGGKGYLGISPLERSTQRSTWSSPIVGAGLTVQLTALTFQGLGNAVGNLFEGIFQSISPSSHTREQGKTHLAVAGDNVSGPIGIFVLLKEVSADGLALVLYLIGVISLTLAVMNALPIPALDGGRLFITLLFRMRHKVLTKDREEQIHGYGFAALMVLILLITIVDVKRFF
ncbi:MAG TPA: M50 family metallopeptidase [Candidatus Saccharimonadales bacterium]|nr:M50 family metallopeptidase [Candidatus Saccharimonadales bacterium]